MKIEVWGEPNLSAEQAVDPKGYISMPLLGQMHVEGLTQQKLTDNICKGLEKYVVKPKVQITFLQFRKPKVHVLGQVNRPGLYEFKQGDKAMEAIAQAGSFTEAADLKGALLTHRDSQKAIPLDLHKLFYDGDMSQNLILEDGDTIYIPEDTKNKCFVLGEVYRPGPYRLQENMTVIEAISMAGGPTKRGYLNRTCVIRSADTGKAQRIQLDMNQFIKNADLSKNIALQPGDVVYVPETSKPNWEQIGNIVSSIVNTSYLLRIW
jgi:polysaccharide export outer membrane protein